MSITRVKQGIPSSSQVFDLYDVLNKFCTNAPYLDFGTFHKESLHKAFLVSHVETFCNDNSITVRVKQNFRIKNCRLKFSV